MTSDTVYTQSQLNSMTKAELLVLCEELGIDSVSDSNLKSEIVSAVLEYQEV